MKKELKTVGRPIPLLEGEEKVTGKAKYSADIGLRGMLHAKILGSPHPHAKIRNIDLSEAKKIDGVVDFLTHENTPRTLHPLLKTPLKIAAFAEDQDGELYLINYEGSLHKLVPEPSVKNPAAFFKSCLVNKS